MSLVSEALKKAQREAAAREARAKGLPPPLHSPASQPYRAKRRRGQGTGAALAIAALLVAAGAGLVLWTKAGEHPAPPQALEEEAPEKGVSSVAAPAASSQPEGAPAPARAATATDEPVPTATSGPATGTAAAPAPAPASSEVRTATAASPPPPSMEVSPGASSTTTAAPAPAAAAKAGPASFVREATLADGTRIHLGGIAYSDAAPLAYLNGRLLGAGEHVESCRVARIERGQVTLDCGGTALILTLE